MDPVLWLVFLLVFLLLVLYIIYLKKQNYKIYVDSLTNINNIAYLKKEYSKFYSKNTLCCAFDFTKFKYLNDKFGHEVGDNCLILFATLLQKYYKNDLKVRRGGDEFLLFTNLSKNQFLHKIKLINNEIIEYYNEGVIPDKFSFNIGIASCTNNTDYKIFMNNADIALYNAKVNKYQYTVFSEEIKEANTVENAILRELEDAIKTKAVVYKYKTIYDYDESVLYKSIYPYISNKDTPDLRKYLSNLRYTHMLDKLDLYFFNNFENLISKYIKSDEKYGLKITSDLILSLEASKFDELCNIMIKNNLLPSNFTIEILVTRYDFDYDNINKRIDHLKSLGLYVSIEYITKYNFNYSFILDSSIDYIKFNSTINELYNNEKYNNKKDYIVFKSIIENMKLYNIKPIISNIDNEDFLTNVYYINNDVLYSKDE